MPPQPLRALDEPQGQAGRSERNREIVLIQQEGIRLERAKTDLVRGKVRPLRDYLLVKPLEWQPSKTIQVVGNQRKTLRGIVVAAGPGVYPKRYNAARTKTWDSRAFRATEAQVGDVVELGGLEIGGYAFPEVLIDNELHVLCRDEDVVGIHAQD